MKYFVAIEILQDYEAIEAVNVLGIFTTEEAAEKAPSIYGHQVEIFDGEIDQYSQSEVERVAAYHYEKRRETVLGRRAYLTKERIWRRAQKHAAKEREVARENEAITFLKNLGYNVNK